jgi:hypothetical protein
MNSFQQVSFFVSATFHPRQDSTLVCGSAPRNASEAAGRLGAGAVSLVVHDENDLPLIGERERAAAWMVPPGVSDELLHGHGVYCIALLDTALEIEWDYLWFIHHDVHFEGDWGALFASFDESDADFYCAMRSQSGGRSKLVLVAIVCSSHRRSNANWVSGCCPFDYI